MRDCVVQSQGHFTLNDSIGILGTIGHVAHGKSTVVKAISGVMTVRFKNELVRNITIKLGYANAKVREAWLLRLGTDWVPLFDRSTNVKILCVLDQVVIVPIDPIKKIIRLVNVLAAVIA